MGKEKRLFTFKKGATYSVDTVNAAMQMVAAVSHKPLELDIETNKMTEDSFSDYDVFDKTVKITVEIID